MSTQSFWNRPKELPISKQDLIFAQMRGIILHLDARSGWEPDNHVQNGVDAMEVFYGYAGQHSYQQLYDEFNQLGEDAYQAFIRYWNSFLK